MEPPDGISPLIRTTKEPLLPSEDTAQEGLTRHQMDRCLDLRLQLPEL